MRIKVLNNIYLPFWYYFIYVLGKKELKTNINLDKLTIFIYYYFSFLNFNLVFLLKKMKNVFIYCAKDKLINTVKFFKNSVFFNCNQLLDIVIVDYFNFFDKKNRFKIIYVLLSVFYNIRIYVNSFLNQYDSLESLSLLYKSSNWLERELWDMYGIFFLNHPNLRRILTDYGFKGFPFRKDFPLSGYFEVYYNDIIKSVGLYLCELSQEYRFFKYEAMWR